MMTFADFHFLRPEWLGLLLPGLLIWWVLWRRHDHLRSWRQAIAPHLLPHLLVGVTQKKTRVRPVHLLGLFWLLGIIASAGPSWQKEPSPFAEEQAVLVILLKVTPSMHSTDVQPQRLQRAVLKIKQLLALRSDTRTALIAYAGSAHRVMPFTRDHKLIHQFAGELGPDVMPIKGDALVEAVTLGAGLINRAGAPGSMLLLADTVDQIQFNALREVQANNSVPVHLWAMTGVSDKKQLQDAADILGGQFVSVTLDDADVHELHRAIGRSMSTIGKSEGQRWQDAGYWITPILVLFALFWFRRGWVIRWAD